MNMHGFEKRTGHDKESEKAIYICCHDIHIRGVVRHNEHSEYCQLFPYCFTG